MTLKEFILAVRSLIANGFCQRAYARDSLGNLANQYDSDAICFCLIGAAQRVRSLNDAANLAFHAYCNKLMEKIPPLPGDFLKLRRVIEFNDSVTQIEVLELLDLMILELP